MSTSSLVLTALTEIDDMTTCIVPAQPKLENISLDVLLQIFVDLTWRDLLSLRQVSTGMCSATYQRVLWHNLIKCSPSRFMLSRCIQKCLSQELEDAFLGLQRANRRWTNPGTPRRFEKIYGLGNVWSYNYKILPGGRWLIKLEVTAELLYTDLNSPRPATWYTLIPASIRRGHRFLPWTPLRMVFDHESDAEYLCFTIAIMGPGIVEVTDKVPVTFNIWRCTNDFDENGREIGLNAIKVSEFGEEDLEVIGTQVCMRGDFFAYINTETRRPVVVDWKLANGHTKNPPSFRFTRRYFGRATLHVLPQTKQLFCRSHSEWDIMTWKNLTPTTSADLDDLDSGDIELSSVDDPSFSGEELEIILEDNIASFTGYAKPNRYVRVSFNPASPSPFTTLNKQTLYEPVAPNLRCIFEANRGLILSSNPADRQLEIFTCGYNTSERRQGRQLSVSSWRNILPLTSVKRVLVDDVSCRCLLMGASQGCYLVDL
ncbi:hypothetical protein BJ165DRAFT_1473746 [Panaeolus papilionaceus]|nr:hypothetical protein BJ165DRAFT_1473746 [Panaeolus papilionaceus]